MIYVSKEIRINVRTTEQIKTDLEITADLRGISVSALVNSLVVKAIREEKEREPQAFKKSVPSGSQIVTAGVLAPSPESKPKKK